MIRSEAMRVYQREYFHALRNQLASGHNMDSEAAAIRATQRVKKFFMQDAKTYNYGTAIQQLELDERWSRILIVLIDFQMMLTFLPLDERKLPPKDIPIEIWLEQWDDYRAKVEANLAAKMEEAANSV